jgi:hypothetical protein
MGSMQSRFMQGKYEATENEKKIIRIRKEIEARMYGKNANSKEAQDWENAKLQEIIILQNEGSDQV